MGEFVIGVVGDFSAAAGAQAGEPRFREVDRDDFGELFARLSPRVETGLPFCPALALADFEDLHPDGLAARVPALAKLLEARDEVANPGLMRRLIADAGVDVEAVEGTAAEPEPQAAPPRRVSEGELLDAMLGGEPGGGAVEVVPARSSADPAFERVIAEIVASSADDTDYARLDRWREAIDAEIAARTRAILHAPAFQRLEASWRSLRSLVMGLETGEALRIRVLDLSRDALAGGLDGDGRAPRLEARVAEPGAVPGGVPFGLLVFDYALGAGDEDARLLAALADVAGRAGVPAVTGLCPRLWADGDIDWDGLGRLRARLRGVAGSDRLALALPRLLQRLPYGPETDPVERFAFDERPGPGPGDYVWGNAGYALAFAAGEAMASLGRVAAVAKFAQLDNLPFHAARHGAEVESIGPTDRLLSEAEVERAAELGLAPVAGFRGRDTAFVARFQSIAGVRLFPD